MKGRYEIADCGDYYLRNPLPCPRTLWDYHSTESWAHRFDQFKSNELGDKVFTIGDLEASGRDQAGYGGQDEEFIMGLVKWCEEVSNVMAYPLMIY